MIGTLKIDILYYIEHTLGHFGFMTLLCHYLCEMGYIVRRISSVTELLHNRIMARNKQEYLSSSVITCLIHAAVCKDAQAILSLQCLCFIDIYLMAWLISHYNILFSNF